FLFICSSSLIILSFPTRRSSDLGPLTLDNGQHILIGAYRDCLALMRTVGVDVERALRRLPMTLRYADGTGLAFPDWAPPFDALADRKSTRLNSSHVKISYAVFCL